MATDNFLTTKSVLGLAERVVNCPPPEIIDFTDLPWNKSGTIESEKMIINSLSGNAGVTQMGKLQDGQLAIMKFREEFTDGANGDIIFMPIF